MALDDYAFTIPEDEGRFFRLTQRNDLYWDYQYPDREEWRGTTKIIKSWHEPMSRFQIIKRVKLTPKFPDDSSSYEVLLVLFDLDRYALEDQTDTDPVIIDANYFGRLSWSDVPQEIIDQLRPLEGKYPTLAEFQSRLDSLMDDAEELLAYKSFLLNNTRTGYLWSIYKDKQFIKSEVPDLKRGDTGLNVVTLQLWLRMLRLPYASEEDDPYAVYDPGHVTGLLDEQTMLAVHNFQHNYVPEPMPTPSFVDGDNFIGRDTFYALEVLLRERVPPMREFADNGLFPGDYYSPEIFDVALAQGLSALGFPIREGNLETIKQATRLLKAIGRGIKHFGGDSGGAQLNNILSNKLDSNELNRNLWNNFPTTWGAFFGAPWMGILIDPSNLTDHDVANMNPNEFIWATYETISILYEWGREYLRYIEKNRKYDLLDKPIVLSHLCRPLGEQIAGRSDFSQIGSQISLRIPQGFSETRTAADGKTYNTGRYYGSVNYDSADYDDDLLRKQADLLFQLDYPLTVLSPDQDLILHLQEKDSEMLLPKVDAFRKHRKVNSTIEDRQAQNPTWFNHPGHGWPDLKDTEAKLQEEQHRLWWKIHDYETKFKWKITDEYWLVLDAGTFVNRGGFLKVKQTNILDPENLKVTLISEQDAYRLFRNHPGLATLKEFAEFCRTWKVLGDEIRGLTRKDVYQTKLTILRQLNLARDYAKTNEVAYKRSCESGFDLLNYFTDDERKAVIDDSGKPSKAGMEKYVFTTDDYQVSEDFPTKIYEMDIICIWQELKPEAVKNMPLVHFLGEDPAGPGSPVTLRDTKLMYSVHYTPEQVLIYAMGNFIGPKQKRFLRNSIHFYAQGLLTKRSETEASKQAIPNCFCKQDSREKLKALDGESLKELRNYISQHASEIPAIISNVSSDDKKLTETAKAYMLLAILNKWAKLPRLIYKKKDGKEQKFSLGFITKEGLAQIIGQNIEKSEQENLDLDPTYPIVKDDDISSHFYSTYKEWEEKARIGWQSLLCENAKGLFEKYYEQITENIKKMPFDQVVKSINRNEKLLGDDKEDCQLIVGAFVPNISGIVRDLVSEKDRSDDIIKKLIVYLNSLIGRELKLLIWNVQFDLIENRLSKLVQDNLEQLKKVLLPNGEEPERGPIVTIRYFYGDHYVVQADYVHLFEAVGTPIIGRTGSSGTSTGPHLHLQTKWCYVKELNDSKKLKYFIPAFLLPKR